MNSSPLIFVLYDSVTNSIFESQVKNVLHTMAHKNPYQPIHLVSFERYPTDRMQQIRNITITYLKRLPFVGTASIWYATHQLKYFLRIFPAYSMIARGPIAGLIAQKALNPQLCRQLTIQARGLLAQEYRYTYLQSTGIMAYIHTMRAQQLDRIESKVYASRNQSLTFLQRIFRGSQRPIQTTIEAVSPALKEYLIKTYGAESASITIAHNDISHTITIEQKNKWRTTIRAHLGIPEDWTVYCYNGSAKKWQKPDMIISFFKEKVITSDASFLLIISTDAATFKAIINDTIPAHNHRIISVKHHDIYQYLAAADYGLLFRDEHIINWVSRPTKVLEYHAAHLPILHNKTIDYVNNIDTYLTDDVHTPVQIHKIMDLDYPSGF